MEPTVTTTDDVEKQQSTIGRSDATSGRETMLDAYIRSRQIRGRDFLQRVSAISFFVWILYVIMIIVPVANDENLHPVLTLLITTNAIMTILLLAACALLRSKRFAQRYSTPVACVLGLLILTKFAEGVGVDVIVRTRNLFEGHVDTTASVLASRVLGPNQIMFLVTAFHMVRFVLIKQVELVLMYGVLPVLLVLTVLVQMFAVDGNLSYASLEATDILLPVVIILACVLANYFAAIEWHEEGWATFVAHKRVQFESIHREQLLKLAMPIAVAHQLMVGTLQAKRYVNTSVAFFYIRTEETIKIVESIDSLFSMIDRILLEHPNVYKIEGVGNCYMVASGLPKVGNTHYAMERNVMRIISDLQKSMHHAVHMAQFCYQLMRLCNSRGEIDYSLGSTDTIPMHIQGGIHCGEVTAAVVGQSRSFYRLFGDTLNFASRVANVGTPGEVCCTKAFVDAMASTSGERNEPYDFPFRNYVELKGKGVQPIFNLALQHRRDSSKKEISADDVFQEGHSRTQRKKWQSLSILTRGCSSVFDADGRDSGFPQAATMDSIAGEHMRDTKESIQTAQRIISKTAYLLSYSPTESINHYRTASEPTCVTKNCHFVRKVEKLALSRLSNSLVSRKQENRSAIDGGEFGDISSANTVPMEDTHSAHEAKNVVKIETGNESTDMNLSSGDSEDLTMYDIFLGETYESFSKGRFSFLFKPLLMAYGLLWTRFASPAFEEIIQTNTHIHIYELLQRTGSYASIVIFFSLAFFFDANGEVEYSAPIVVFVIFLAFFREKIMRHFRKFAFMERRRPQVDSLENYNLCSGDSCPSTGVTAIKNRIAALLIDFLSLFVILLWLTAVIMTTLFEMKKTDTHSSSGVCLEAFLRPSMLLSVFQIARVGFRGQLTIQLGTAALCIIVLGIGSSLSECNAHVAVIGLSSMLIVLGSNVADAASVELRERTQLVFCYASELSNVEGERVLQRLFPPHVCAKMQKGEPIPFCSSSEQVAILWADLVGFTKIASELDSYTVMELLDKLYTDFDGMVCKENLWKMDTIGDAYIVVGGLMEDQPIALANVLQKLLSLGQKMISSVKSFNQKHGHNIGIRIGVHSGPVTTGIVGTLRPRFQAFGKTVLEAERMEGYADTNHIYVSYRATKAYRKSLFDLKKKENDNVCVYVLNDTSNSY